MNDFTVPQIIYHAAGSQKNKKKFTKSEKNT